MLRFEKTIAAEMPGFEVWYENGVFIGYILAKEDGFYDFWPELRGGYWSEMMLRLISDKLKELNAPWEKQIEESFNGNHSKS